MSISTIYYQGIELARFEEWDFFSFNDTILKLMWNELALSFFPDTPLDYRVCWTRRTQRRTLASCNIRDKIIRVSDVMLLKECQNYLEPLVYHEMCHAVVGVSRARGRRVIHGRDFKILEREHPGVSELDRWIKSGGWSKAFYKRMAIANAYSEYLHKK